MLGRQGLKKEEKMETRPLFMLGTEDYAKSKEVAVFLTIHRDRYKPSNFILLLKHEN